MKNCPRTSVTMNKGQKPSGKDKRDRAIGMETGEGGGRSPTGPFGTETRARACSPLSAHGGHTWLQHPSATTHASDCQSPLATMSSGSSPLVHQVPDSNRQYPTAVIRPSLMGHGRLAATTDGRVSVLAPAGDQGAGRRRTWPWRSPTTITFWLGWGPFFPLVSVLNPMWDTRGDRPKKSRAAISSSATYLRDTGQVGRRLSAHTLGRTEGLAGPAPSPSFPERLLCRYDSFPVSSPPPPTFLPKKIHLRLLHVEENPQWEEFCG